MKALRKYREITGRHDLKVGIWDNCMEVIETNGKRIRVRYDYVKWQNNSGSLTERVVYLDRTRGRKVLHAYRQGKINELKGIGCGYWLSELV